MSEDRADVAEADEDGGRGEEKYEINLKAGTSEDRERMPCGDALGAVLKVATMSQHTKTISPAEKRREWWLR